MPFPESERVIFRNNPLNHVICQLRFPSILAIGARDPAGFQDHLRAEYPLYEKEEQEPPEISEELTELLSSVGVSAPWRSFRHSFSTEDGTRIIKLSRDFVSVTENDYTEWDHLREEIQRAKTALEEEYTPPFYQRVGLRYQDVIDREAIGLEGAPWDALLDPALIGMLGPGFVRDEIDQVYTQASVNLADVVEDGSVTLRHGLADLERENGESDDVYVIDADFFTTSKSEGNDVLDILDQFNRLAGNLFRWAITDTLRDALDPMDVD